ncbi:hypothetical protein CON53_10760 [Bacillus cereus]|uniref:phage antirepressor KilAC domain-containing protein n=1 Tax=Bacillus cereus group TaxID=86661 RepID=UPI000BED3D18|nr:MULTISPECIES: phage antirepressor KilAC domain-containing protein [Bacillus cereus group]PEE18081.1 hypothetical protein CON53_10760 [Bacillus cereus]PGP20066.1 hypothetical protein COA01_20315 [Bacillus cereus]PHB62640.1 hypothetical protein COE87_14030 [Bacillus wiedmannii]
MTKVNTREIIVTKEEREALIERVEVLKKVKDLLLLPGLEMATTKQVAEFYEVKLTTINNMILMHREELEADGVVFKRYLELEREVNSQHFRELKIARRGVNVFPKRAILRVGMLLRDSEVAKEVREQLLNIEEKAQEVAPTILTADIDHETKLINAVGIAAAECDVIAYGKALKELEAWKNRHICEDADKYQNIKALVATTTITEICKRRLGKAVSSIEANKILKDLGIYKEEKLDGRWIPAEKYEIEGWFIIKRQLGRGGFQYEFDNYRITEKGAEEITKLLKQHLMREATQAA